MLRQVVVCRVWVILLIINSCHFFPFDSGEAHSLLPVLGSLSLRGGKENGEFKATPQHAPAHFAPHRFVLYSALRSSCAKRLHLWSFLFKHNTEIAFRRHRSWTPVTLLFVWKGIGIRCLFWAIRQIIHTCMNSFGQMAAIPASDKPQPKSGNHQMPPTLPLYHLNRQHTHTCSSCTHTQACTLRASAAVPHTQKAHMLTRKEAPCSLYLPTDADDRAADECRLTRDWRVNVPS